MDHANTRGVDKNTVFVELSYARFCALTRLLIYKLTGLVDTTGVWLSTSELKELSTMNHEFSEYL